MQASASASTSTFDELPAQKLKMQTGLACCNCGEPATPALSCPVCKKAGIRTSIFCTPDCYKRNYSTHKRLHEGVPPPSAPPVPTEGTYDPFTQVPGFRYTGSLRAVYPTGDAVVPKRTVPDHIPKPDYATNAKGVSYSEQVSRRVDQIGKRLDKREIEAMRKSCKLAREILDIAAAAVKPGVTTLELDELVHNECVKRNCYPSPLGYRWFPRSVCTSINEVVCHGIPDARALVEGDIINLDVTVFHEGFHGDINATYPVGKVSDENAALIASSRECLDNAIRACKPGLLIRDIGKIIEATAKKNGHNTSHTFVGHGINQLFHPAPDIPHYADNKARGTLKAGMCFTIEPMICGGHHKDTHWPDSWTSVTVDGKNSSQFEETLLITETGVEVLTAAPGWKLDP